MEIEFVEAGPDTVITNVERAMRRKALKLVPALPVSVSIPASVFAALTDEEARAAFGLRPFVLENCVCGTTATRCYANHDHAFTAATLDAALEE